MPVYEFHCAEHGITNVLRSIADRDLPVACPDCGADAVRLTSAPRLTLMSAANREAWARNERSAHEPRRAQRSACGHVHGAGDSCAGSGPGAGAPALRQAASSGRPWMLGH
jgi:putative FmdB family regulatory protein|tara:strand:- start:319 stop:651 length:333 start_codon:yes stop_codon:yes gene_type:complete